MKTHQTWKTSEQNLVKSRIALEKTRLSNKTKAEKVAQCEKDIVDWEGKAVQTKREFGEASDRLKAELERFEHEKAHEIQLAIKSFLEEIMDCQKKTISAWEGYLHDFEATK